MLRLEKVNGNGYAFPFGIIKRTVYDARTVNTKRGEIENEE